MSFIQTSHNIVSMALALLVLVIHQIPLLGVYSTDNIPVRDIVALTKTHQMAKQLPGIVDSGQSEDECSQNIKLFTSSDDWLEQLINPILTTKSQLQQKLQIFTQMYDCLERYSGKLPTDLETIHSLTQYFIVFAGGYQTQVNNSSLSLISLSLSDDPAVVQIRDEANIKPPDGYIYVRFYSSKQAMPDIVKTAFSREGIAGVTIFTRYIAVLSPIESDWQQQALQSQTMPKTISHELVHAYLNSILGSKSFTILPKWYSEGTAIYFSKSVGSNVSIAPDLTIRTISPEDYKQYDLNFRYLEARFGRKHLLALIKESVEKSSPAILLKELNISNEQELESNARSWEIQQTNFAAGVGTAIVLLITLLVVLGIKKLMRPPEYQCLTCGYEGVFIYNSPDGDYDCPNCHSRSYARLK